MRVLPVTHSAILMFSNLGFFRPCDECWRPPETPLVLLLLDLPDFVAAMLPKLVWVLAGSASSGSCGGPRTCTF